jgi:hypothetical protein
MGPVVGSSEHGSAFEFHGTLKIDFVTEQTLASQK